MSLEFIELLIKESFRDGEISAAEKETIVKQGESLGISKETVFNMIDAEVSKLLNKKSVEAKQKQEEDERTELLKLKNGLEGFGICVGLGMCVGILNAYTHHKVWYAYYLMSFLGMIYGYMAYGILIALSNKTKKTPLNWPKSLLITYILLVLAFICFLVIPF